MLHMLQKNSNWKVAEVFFNKPTTKHYLKEISKNIKLAHTSVKKNLNYLTEQNIIKTTTTKKGSRTFIEYEANINNKEYQHYKKIHNQNQIHQSKIIQHIQETLMPKTIVLFGSYQKGEDTETSDIDLYVQCKQETLNLKKYEKKLQRKIQLHFKEEFTNYPKELKNNIINGITLKGQLEGYK